jgi:hypothetical protein
MAAERQRSSLDAMGMPVYSRLNSLVALHRGSLITDSDTTGYLRLVCAKGDGATSRAPTGVSAFQPRSRGCGGLWGVGSPWEFSRGCSRAVVALSHLSTRTRAWGRHCRRARHVSATTYERCRRFGASARLADRSGAPMLPLEAAASARQRGALAPHARPHERG